SDPDVETLTLPLNYRSAPGICAVSSAIVQGKPWALAGEIVPAGPLKELSIENTKPQIIAYPNPELEAEAAILWAQELIYADPAVDPNEICIMARLHSSLHLAEIECIRKRIPYRKLAGGSFFEDKAIATLLAYMKVACLLDEDGRAFRKIINIPFRYIGAKFISDCAMEAQTNEISLLDSMLALQYDLNHPQRQALAGLVTLIKALNQMATTEGSPSKMLTKVVNDTDYIEDLRRNDGLGQEA
ncbi:unnamed protein product, partial [marine sediment metagenome]